MTNGLNHFHIFWGLPSYLLQTKYTLFNTCGHQQSYHQYSSPIQMHWGEHMNKSMYDVIEDKIKGWHAHSCCFSSMT